MESSSSGTFDSHRIGERAAERAAERVGARAFERAEERGVERRTAGSIAGRASQRGVAKRAAPIALTIPERVALRIGRGVLIALPALGGIFALYLMKTDRKRATLERSTGSRLSFMWLFGGAAVTDAVDAVCHFVIAYGMLRELGHHFLAHVGGQLGMCLCLNAMCCIGRGCGLSKA